MPIVQPPQYSKIPNSTTGIAEPCYTFMIYHTESEKKLMTIAEDVSTLSISGLEHILGENTEWWDGWMKSFLEASAKHFSKPYTVQHIFKITKHQLIGNEQPLFPANVVFQPKTIQIRGGIFLINWEYHTTPITIEIPDLLNEEETLPVSNPNELEEMNVDDVPADQQDTGTPLTLDTPTRFYEKNKVKEARLKAKLAMYRAQFQMNKYYEKYGTEVSDSDTEDEMSDEEDGVEEVQL